MEYKRGYFVFNTHNDGREEIIGAFSNKVGAILESKSKLVKENLTSSEVKLKSYLILSDGKVLISVTENLKLGTLINKNELFDSMIISESNSLYEEHKLRNSNENIIRKPKNVVEVKTGWFVSVEFSSQFSNEEVHGAFETEKDANDYKLLIGTENVHCIYERNYVVFEDRINILDSINTKVTKNEKGETLTHEY